MVERTFLIQRYCAGNWPQVRGVRPFITSGPHFLDWIVPGSLESRGQHVLRPAVRRMISNLFPSGGMHRMHYQHRAASEALLREGILMALWSIDSRECLSEESRWGESIEQVARELPFKTMHWVGGQVEHRFRNTCESVEELLSGMPGPAMIREYLSEDRLTLVPVLGPMP